MNEGEVLNKSGTVCIIDDDEAVREAVRLLLFTRGFQTCLYPSADHFLQDPNPPEINVFLLDLRMPGTDGMELHEILISRGSCIPVIFITGHGDIPLAVAAIQRGASDFLTKPFEEGELLTKISAAIENGQRLMAELEERRALKSLLNELTPRESDVLKLIVQGQSNKQVAAELNISPRTVEIHRARVMEKTGADSIVSLVRMVTALEV